MKLIFIVDPLASLNPKKDSSIAMMRAASQRGHDIFTCQTSDLLWANDEVSATLQQIKLTPSNQINTWYEPIAANAQSLRFADAVIMRKDPPFNMEYIYATYLLERAQAQGAKIFNQPQAIRNHNEKLATLEFSNYCPKTLVSQNAKQLKAFINAENDTILKPLDGMGGSSIFRVSKNDPNINVIIETLTQYGTQTIMAQRFIPEITKGDKRVLLIAGKPVPYALARIPAQGETRGNLAAGGTPKAQPLSKRDLEIATAIGEILYKRGLFLVGLDIIGDYLTEINVTSPTCFQEIQAQTNCDVASIFIDALEADLEKPQVS